jgi:hypothetical protein
MSHNYAYHVTMHNYTHKKKKTQTHTYTYIIHVYILSRLLLRILFCDTSVCGLELLVYEALRY